ncbi:hypothetical protein L208DRAFT_1069975, partial [Tricholoma matsutake]
LTHKYSLLSAHCKLYQIAIVMCPDWKLKWFKDHGCTSAQIRDIKKLVWYFYYCHINCYLLIFHQSKNKWVKKSTTNPTHEPSDDITKYLLDPVLASDAIADAGGYMKYWHLASAHRPCLA